MRNQRSARRNSAPRKRKKGSPLGHAMTRIPNFASIDFAPAMPQTPAPGPPWLTPRAMRVSPAYGPDDAKDLAFLDTLPAIAPYLRGPYPPMYVTQPWTIRQYAAFSTAEDSNAFYRRNLAAG